MKKHIYLLYLIAIGLCPSCCCEKPPCPDFSEEEKSWMPNKENDTILFISNLGNEIKFKASSKVETKDYKNNKPKYGGCPDYCSSIISQNYFLASKISQYTNFYFQINKSKDVFNYKIGESDNSYDVYFSLPKSIKSNSMVLGGKEYYDVYVNTVDTIRYSNAFYYKFYATSKFGLLRFENINQEYYERVF